MKRAIWIGLLALPISLFACAKGRTYESSSGGGGDGGDNDPTGAGGGGGSVSSVAASSSTGGPPGVCVTQADCVAFNDICNTGNCINGKCEKSPANEGSSCDDNQFCTENDSCIAGVCTGGTQRFCPSPDTCHIGQCDEAAGSCGSVPGNEGAACVDQDPCTNGGTCNGGSCVGGTPVDCSFLDGVCSVGVCDPQLGCVVQPVNDGTACNDNLYCTVNDVCTAGSCKGQPNTCAAPGDVCKVGTCDEAAKSCVAVPGNDGAACEDGNPCTSGSTCSAGNCVGGQPANNGAACDDGDGCTNGTTCSNGSCGNATMVISQCVSNDQCCPAGCVMNDSDCSITKWSEGTQAWPDEACNPFNSFGFCSTNAQDHADAWATAVCQNNGYSLGIWTGNKVGGCAGDVSMWCQGTIPCTQTYENVCAQGDQTMIEFTCFP